ncbi:MAG: EamA family transporter [Gemmataceae bacterium]
MTKFQLLTMMLAVAGAVSYHLSQKSVPKDAGPLVVLLHAYLVGAALCLLLVLLTSGEQERGELLRPRLISLALGMGVLMIEVGVLLMYRSGWPVGRAALISTLLATAVLLPVGYGFFGESLPPLKVAGLLVCLVGMLLLCW